MHAKFSLELALPNCCIQLLVNGQKIVQVPPPNLPANATFYGGSPSSDKFPLQRCEGDCDSDSQCDFGLVCQQRNADQYVPGCLGTEGYNAEDFCIDPQDVEYELTSPMVATLPTGGWEDDWHLSNEIKVNLNAGEINTIRIEVTFISGGGGNIDYLKIEGLPISSPSSSFRNPPHFMSEQQQRNV